MDILFARRTSLPQNRRVQVTYAPFAIEIRGTFQCSPERSGLSDAQHWADTQAPSALLEAEDNSRAEEA